MTNWLTDWVTDQTKELLELPFGTKNQINKVEYQTALQFMYPVPISRAQYAQYVMSTEIADANLWFLAWPTSIAIIPVHWSVMSLFWRSCIKHDNLVHSRPYYLFMHRVLPPTHCQGQIVDDDLWNSSFVIVKYFVIWAYSETWDCCEAKLVKSICPVPWQTTSFTNILPKVNSVFVNNFIPKQTQSKYKFVSLHSVSWGVEQQSVRTQSKVGIRAFCRSTPVKITFQMSKLQNKVDQQDAGLVRSILSHARVLLISGSHLIIKLSPSQTARSPAEKNLLLIVNVFKNSYKNMTVSLTTLY